VFAEDGAGRLVFHAVPPAGEELDALLATIARRIERLLVRRRLPGMEADAEETDPWVEEAPVLAGLTAASVQGRLVLGPRRGAEVRRCGSFPEQDPAPAVRGPCHAARGGFDLDATVVIAGQDRARLERVCRYALRPPIARDRIRLTAEGDVLLELRHRWSDGTTHLRFHPLELLERLASLTPRPRINLVLYYGVFAAHAAWRARLHPPGHVDRGSAGPPVPGEPDGASGPGGPRSAACRSNWLWAQLMQRTFGFDVLVCPQCGGRLRLVALIEHAGTVRRIRHHLGLPAEVPPPRPGRAPPRQTETRLVWSDPDIP
jgi:hypothetical protein